MEKHLSDWCQLKSLHVRPLSAVEGQVETTTLFSLNVECNKSKKTIETYSWCNQVQNIKDIKDSGGEIKERRVEGKKSYLKDGGRL